MKSDFKALDWLRRVRDDYAKQTKGLGDRERIATLRQETGDAMSRLTMHEPGVVGRVRETGEPYSAKKRGKS